MLGEFFAARASEIDDALLDLGPHGRFATVEANGLTPVSLARLGDVLAIAPFDALMGVMTSRPSPNGDAVLVGLPAALRDALAESAGLDDAARAWVSTDELKLSGWRDQAAISVVRALADLARAARAGEHNLWYWWSL